MTQSFVFLPGIDHPRLQQNKTFKTQSIQEHKKSHLSKALQKKNTHRGLVRSEITPLRLMQSTQKHKKSHPSWYMKTKKPQLQSLSRNNHKVSECILCYWISMMLLIMLLHPTLLRVVQICSILRLATQNQHKMIEKDIC